ncbi:MAG: hypothetical protein R3E93_06315 [Thiothrix sp.]
MMHVLRIGMNPGAQITQGLIEAERLFGACNSVLAETPITDRLLLSKTTLTADGLTLLDKVCLSEQA